MGLPVAPFQAEGSTSIADHLPARYSSSGGGREGSAAIDSLSCLVMREAGLGTDSTRQGSHVRVSMLCGHDVGPKRLILPSGKTLPSHTPGCCVFAEDETWDCVWSQYVEAVGSAVVAVWIFQLAGRHAKAEAARAERAVGWVPSLLWFASKACRRLRTVRMPAAKSFLPRVEDGVIWVSLL